MPKKRKGGRPLKKVKNRPICLNPGCGRPVTHCGTRWRPFCQRCHVAGYKKLPLPEGVTSFKTGKCSNSDGHLGFMCGWDYEKSPWALGLTQIDHKDGNHWNNTPENADELCDPCHTMKGMLQGDYKLQNKKKV